MSHLQTDLDLVESVIAFALVIGLVALVLKPRGVLTDDDAPRYAGFITQAVLPAVIFSQMSRTSVSGRQFLAVAAMMIAGAGSLALAYASGRLLKLPRATTGALMIASSFGAAAMIGYPLVSFTYPGDQKAMADAVVVSQLGIGLPLFILCPLVAVHFGDRRDKAGVAATTVAYLRSPIFVALVVGAAVGALPVPLDAPWLQPFLTALDLLGSALTVLACVVLGITLRLPRGWRSARVRLLAIVPISAALAMVVQPLLADGVGAVMGVGGELRQVLVLVAAMPSAVMGTVFAARYECDPATASTLAVVNICLSIVLVPVVFAVGGHGHGVRGPLRVRPGDRRRSRPFANRRRSV